jgi:hypothetical protein
MKRKKYLNQSFNTARKPSFSLGSTSTKNNIISAPTAQSSSFDSTVGPTGTGFSMLNFGLFVRIVIMTLKQHKCLVPITLQHQLQTLSNLVLDLNHEKHQKPYFLPSHLAMSPQLEHPHLSPLLETLCQQQMDIFQHLALEQPTMERHHHHLLLVQVLEIPTILPWYLSEGLASVQMLVKESFIVKWVEDEQSALVHSVNDRIDGKN